MKLLKQATESDLDFLRDSHNVSRHWFFDTHEVSKEEHEKWFKNQLLVYVVKYCGISVGSVRAKLIGGYWELHWEIIPQFRGKGLATKAVAELIKKLPTRDLRARIKEDNIASIKVALANGLVKVSPTLYELTDPQN